jgi:hypothetical protein
MKQISFEYVFDKSSSEQKEDTEKREHINISNESQNTKYEFIEPCPVNEYAQINEDFGELVPVVKSNSLSHRTIVVKVDYKDIENKRSLKSFYDKNRYRSLTTN